MPVFGGNVALDRDPHISEVPASMGEMIGATAREAWHDSPTMEVLGIDELARAKGDTKGPIDRVLDIGEQSPVALVAPIASALKTAKRAAEWIGGYDTTPAPTKELTAADARGRVDAAGMSKMITLGDEPIREGALDIMLKRANERHMRETTMARGPSGFTAGVFSVGTSLFVGALDPLNVGAAFIPIVGEARWGKLMYSAGESAINRAGVRFGLGAAQGAAFTAAFQPLEAWAHTQEGRDFTMAEALHNVLMGAGTFGLLHVGGGVAADIYRGFRGRPLYPHGEGEPMGPAAVPHTAARETDPRLSIFNETYANLRTAGMEADEAAQNASVVAERYAARAERIGADSYELFRSEGIDIQSGTSPVSTDARSFEQARALPMDEESRLGRARELGFDTDKVWYHGTARADRLTEKGRIDPKRATSGPMPYFTDDPALGSSYATRKADTSLEVPDDYAGWFKYKPPGARNAVDIDRAWYHLDPETRRTVAERLPDIKEDEYGGKITYEKGQGHPAGDLKAWNEHYLPREGRGNPLRAAKEIWLNGGILFNDEERFLEVLKLAGMKDVEFDSPHRQQPGVLPAYIRARNPLDTSNVEQLHALLPELQALARRSRRPPQIGSDMWAKVATSVRMWLERYEEDLKNGTTHAWTSIPDEVTKFLESKGFDAVLDTGGKGGGPRHAVLIPFRPQQVRSIFARFDQEKADSPKILDQAAKPPGPDLFTQREAEGQTSLPGTERIGEGEQAQRAADQPLKPKAEQKPMDVGLFGDESKQKSFFQAPTFYSAVERTVTDAKQEKASPEQWLGMIKNAAGVKAEEMEWLGLESWLKEQSGPVTKQQLADYVRANRIEVKEVERGDPTSGMSMLAKRLDAHRGVLLDSLKTAEHVETARRFNTHFREDVKDFSAEEVIAAAEEAREGPDAPRRKLETVIREMLPDVNAMLEKNDRLGFDTVTQARTAIASPHESVTQWEFNTPEDRALAQKFRAVMEDYRVVPRLQPTKFSSWMTPKGLENERELVLTLPQKEAANGKTQLDFETPLDFAKRLATDSGDNWDDLGPNGRQRYLDEAKRLDPRASGYRVPSGHGYGDEASDVNRLAHIFTADATIDGKKTLLIREGQSDWHQAGHKQGYQKTLPKIDDLKFERVEPGFEGREISKHWFSLPNGDSVVGWGATEAAALKDAFKSVAGDLAQASRTGVPDAPFKTTWPALVLKRMIRYAAEHGYEKLAWVTGDTVAERYNISRAVSSIEVVPRTDAASGEKTRSVTINLREDRVPSYIELGIDKNGIIDNATQTDFKGKPLTEVVGKGLAEKIMESDRQTLEGEGLKIGGEFHRKLYDDVFVREANKLTKKYGAKVEDGELTEAGGAHQMRYEGPELTAEEIRGLINDLPENEPVSTVRALRDIERNLRAGGVFDDAVETFGSNRVAEILKGEFKRSDVTVHTLPITDDLRKAAVEQGFPLFQREGGEPRGRITLDDNKAIVQLFSKANASTFMHEMGHLWLEEMIRDASHEKATQGVKNDLKTILSWLGVEKPEDIQTSQDEQWARGFEQYLREGSAPSQELAGAFAKFKAWLTAIYRALTDLGTPITDDIRGVMDRMLATDEQIKAYRERRPSPAVEILADLPPRAKADIAQGGIASLINGEPVRVGEMIEAGAARDPRIQESIDRAGQSENVSRETAGEAPSAVEENPPRPAAPETDIPEDQIVTTHVGAAATRGPRARDPESWSLLEFIAAHGGIDPTDALIGDVRALFGGKRRFIPGFGDVVRKGGMRLDRAREAAVEAGYLHDPGWNTDKQATSTISDLLEAMDFDNRGQKVYKYDRLPEQAQNAERQRVMEENLRDAESRFDDALVDGDLDPTVIDPKLYKRTLEIMTREGENDPILAFERAIAEDEERYDKAANVRRSEVPHIQGWDAEPHVAGATSARGREAAPGGGEFPGRPEALRPSEGARPGVGPDRAFGSEDENTQRSAGAAWRDLARRTGPADEPDVIAASEKAASLPEPASLAPEPDKRVAAAEKAAADAEAVYNAAAPYLPEDIKAIVERRMLEIDREGEDSTHVLQQGAACLAAAVGMGA